MSVLERDFCTDPQLVQDPTACYAALRGLGVTAR
jgi:hypothetical protein